MAYKPTEMRWHIVRLAIFGIWPGLPVAGLLMWLTDLSLVQCLAAGAVVVLVLDALVESLRKGSDADGE